MQSIIHLLKRIDETSKQRNEAEKNPNFLNEPWRKIHETLTDVPQLKETLVNNISESWHKTETSLKILLLGQAGSGKSSFVNACLTALLQEGRVVKRAVDGAVGSENITEGLTHYKLKIKTGKKTENLPVQLVDFRGLSKGDKGVQTGDIEKICRGYIKAGYLINPKEGIKSNDKMYRQHPQEKDKIHCVVYVLAADEEVFVQDEVLDQFKTIKRMFRKDMPQLILLTKIDRLGIDDITQIFRDKRVKERCKAAANTLNLCDNDVYPQSSYSDEVVPCDYKDVVTLFNIKTIMERANDFLSTPESSD
ncbi:interferon-induced protein 44-like [Saccostrea cucullata]|uniref:interferon-induced protein 44-like n=1 Tax=Saccostrea cuccullata TaxID=36930 RepID=UPI002ED48199